MKIAFAAILVLGAFAGPSTVTFTCSPFIADAAAPCCKVCRKGKACGDSCISREKTCEKGKGCACDAG